MDAKNRTPLDSLPLMRKIPSRFRSGATTWAPLTCLVAALVCGLVGCDGNPPQTKAPKLASTPGPVFLLGFDGLDPRFVETFEKEGLLPNFAKLRAEGAVGPVRSTLPFISPPAWTTVSTGSPPSDHGVWSFWIPEPGNPRGRYVDARCRLAPTIWQELSALGRTVGIVDVPVTCPPDSVNGFMVGGFPYPPNAPLTFPPDLEEKLVAEGYKRDAFNGPPRPGDEKAWLAELWDMARTRRRLGLKLLFEKKPDLSMIVFTIPDRIQHHLWKFTDPAHPAFREDAAPELKTSIRDVYVWCDEVLGEVRGRIPPGTTLFVFSDHGFGPAYRGVSKSAVLARLPEALRSKGTGGVNLFGGDFYLENSSKADRRELTNFLDSLKSETGEPLVRAAHDLFPEVGTGNGTTLGPAVFAEEAEGFLFVPGDSADALTGELAAGAFSGYHRRLGYFAATGHPIFPGPVREFDLQDIPAMTLHLLGEAIPRRFVHNIPRRLFPLGYFVERPMRFVGAPTDGLRPPSTAGEERGAPLLDEGIEEQLRSLGYTR